VFEFIVPTAIAISLASYHFDREVKHNEVNPGVFVELNHDYVVGVYRNSRYRTTVLAGRQFAIGTVGSVNVGALAAVCTGYDFGLPFCASLTISDSSGVTLALVPPISKSSGVVGLSYRIPLK
jgi:hypothetical protein